jgi:hypothetical protein
LENAVTPIAQIAPVPEEPIHTRQVVDHDLVRWQTRLLPFMIRFVVAMAVVFFCFSAVLLYEVTSFIENDRGQDIRATIQAEIATPVAASPSSDDVTNHALLLLEADALSKRYREASALLLSRIWSRQLAFITGMVLAFVGAVFILGKLSESASEISGEATGWKVGITSASPGIILSFFGTVLLVSALFSQATLDVSDGPAYASALRSAARTSTPATDAPGKESTATQPLDLNQLEQLGQKRSPAEKPR